MMHRLPLRNRESFLKSNLFIEPSKKNLPAVKKNISTLLNTPRKIADFFGDISITKYVQDSFKDAEIKDIMSAKVLFHYDEKKNNYTDELLSDKEIAETFEQADKFFEQNYTSQRIQSQDKQNHSLLLKNKSAEANNQKNKKIIVAFYGLGDSTSEWKRRLFAKNRDFLEKNKDVDILLSSMQNMPDTSSFSNHIHDTLRKEFYETVDEFLVKDGRSKIPSNEFIENRAVDTIKEIGKMGYKDIVLVGNSRGSFAILKLLEAYERIGGKDAFHHAHLKGAILTSPVVNAQNAVIAAMPENFGKDIFDFLDINLFSSEDCKIKQIPLSVLSGTKDELCSSDKDTNKPLQNYYSNDVLERACKDYIKTLTLDKDFKFFDMLGITENNRDISVDNIIDKVAHFSDKKVSDEFIVGFKNFFKNHSKYHSDILSPKEYIKEKMTDNIKTLEWYNIDNAHHTLFIPSFLLEQYFKKP